MHRLATIHNITDRQTTDRRNTVPIVRPLVRSAKNYLVFVKVKMLTYSHWLKYHQDITLQLTSKVLSTSPLPTPFRTDCVQMERQLVK